MQKWHILAFLALRNFTLSTACSFDNVFNCLLYTMISILFSVFLIFFSVQVEIYIIDTYMLKLPPTYINKQKFGEICLAVDFVFTLTQ